ncbi:Cytochrome b5 [Eufriesea mexicana]|uniref:Cytochrome b5 n=1 Tax=Eufriesea mexicana TaxID=516756 RepID=A0A310SML8_9HYME|nr:PREDICTED: cytochrome b5-like [Eufriesea mexicana]XP_017754898.1 PREDICTED: cytochrome b5-like [Eufriesea mexicana]XP_017754899.1 PREDICTED: cytochrome b5-like [Eufriesea mexicana]XP_017754900.1 PREDICTED: cytochrome b5-like [Eufriesea mexicana]XP_017754902.1 PREDICTED: cytochrome b5-like [Eufriesea mexicana]OAD58596.1 Cytochrome b5 [Eufriesea mexicana]OAD58597.1 Cytochrome b5 [Eufriesea mexicana]
MDLLSLTILELRDTKPSQEDFLELEEQSNESEEGSSKLRRPKHDKEETKSCSKESEQLRMINLDEVAWHDTVDNCWVVIHDYVYDCTDFLKTHPGGSDVILEYAGRDATLAFIGTGHSPMAKQSLQVYLIGELPPEERIFRVPNGLKVTGF